MTTMHAVHLAGLDLNLLVALDALLVERHVTRAAKRVGLTQPAMSHALARLRHLFSDPLFVRTPTGMVPTERALGLAPTLARALTDLQRVISEPPRFDPATAQRSFTVVTSDYIAFALLPTVMATLATTAPHVDLEVRNSPIDLDRLAQGSVDLVIRPTSKPKVGFHDEPLATERFVCLMRQGHPLARRPLTLARYCEASHVLIAPGGTRSSFLDDALTALGRSRRVALVLPQFLVAPHVVAASDLLITLGSRMAHTFQAMLPLVLKKPPLEIPLLGMSQVWHERQAHDPALAWLRQQFRDAAAGLTRP